MKQHDSETPPPPTTETTEYRPNSEHILVLDPPPAFRLMDLPLEMRTKVYVYSISSGSPQVICTSHKIMDEALHLIASEGKFRINIKSTTSVSHYVLRVEPPDLETMRLSSKIQQMEILIDFTNTPDFTSDLHLSLIYLIDALSSLIKPLETKKDCSIVLKGVRFSKGSMDRCIIFRCTLGLMEKMTDWERVFLTFNTKDAPALQTYWSETYHDGTTHDSPRAKSEAFYKMAEARVKMRLGPAIWHNGVEEGQHYLGFRPREHQSRRG